MNLARGSILASRVENPALDLEQRSCDMFRFHHSDGCGSLRGSVRQHIESLGNTPDEIAGRLAEFGVRGVPGKATDCAVARYLNATVVGPEPVSRLAVYHGSVRIYGPGTVIPAVVRLSRPMSAFIRGFDLGTYPELVEDVSMAHVSRGPRLSETAEST
jgi:hypothetical protein